ncbi:cyclin-dependent kinase [Entamoeba marina]
MEIDSTNYPLTEIPSSFKTPNKRYKKDNVDLGAGSYGVVSQRTDTVTNQTVAVKRFKEAVITKELQPEILREIKCLRELEHENIVKCVDFFFHRNSLYVVMEFHPLNLDTLCRGDELQRDPARIKKYLRMLLSGVHYLHMNFLLHRDIKPSNVLVSKDDVLKLTDFGSVRPYGSKDEKFTKGVITPSYKPPEILYGASFYGPAVDVWGIGCIFAEMCNGKILFDGPDETTILGCIYNVLGTPNDSKATQWEGINDYDGFRKPRRPIPHPSLRKCVNCSEEGYRLLELMLKYSPNKRISCEKALQHNYFK